MKYSKVYKQEIAAAKAGISARTARRYKRSGQNPSKKVRTYRTRLDPFDEVWEDVRTMFERDCGLEAKTVFEWLQIQYPEKFEPGQLRTLQRRVREWRATDGPEKDVKFPQNIQPGRQSQSDYTWCNELGVLIRGEPFPHMLFHFMLPYSRWEAVSLAFSESFESLTDGYRRAVRKLGAVAKDHRTDNLAAAVPIGERHVFQQRWEDFLGHYDVEPSANNPRQSHENGSVEKSHDELKTAIDQRLRLRVKRDFDSVEAYMKFVEDIVESRNKKRKERLMEEMKILMPLPERDWSDPKELYPTVSAWSTIVVQKALYSVPSRLIGMQVRVMVYPERIQVYLGRKLLQEMPRVPAGKKCINYRHLISQLLRKPGAFRNYQFREELFPSSIFRRAFDRLCNAGIDRGEREYLRLLNAAAMNGEQDVALAIEALLSEDCDPTEIAVKALVEKKKEVPKVVVEQPDLRSYDRLLKVTTLENESYEQIDPTART
jgi:hypothetical protein